MEALLAADIAREKTARVCSRFDIASLRLLRSAYLENITGRQKICSHDRIARLSQWSNSHCRLGAGCGKLQ
jgi:hypothetical protein